MIPEEDPAVAKPNSPGSSPAAPVARRRRGGSQAFVARARVMPLPGQEKLSRYCSGTPCAFSASRFPRRGRRFYTDARHYAEAGVPVMLYGAGPRTISEANAKRADENWC